jgi:hypothetical protein
LGGALQEPLVPPSEESVLQAPNPLAETDAVAPRPAIDCPFRARCDECGKEYVYKPSEVLRSELEPPESFIPHPLFSDEDTGSHPVVAE